MRLLLPIVLVIMLVCWLVTPGRFEPVRYLPGAPGPLIERALSAELNPTTAPATNPTLR